jgi:LPS O-antigen subunit length determinant protein (WzzB/FepE family)
MVDWRLVRAYILTAGLAFLLAFTVALSVSPTYSTDALIIPKEQTNQGQLSTLAATTRLLGIGSGGDQSTNFAKFQKYWGSRDIADEMLKKYPDLQRRMFSGNWDATNRRWYDHPHTFRQYLAVPLNWIFGVYPNYGATSPQELADYIKSAMKLDVDPQGGQVRISFSNTDAHFAQWFLSTIIAETDRAVRDAEQRRDKDFINFARDRLERETNVGYRDALTDSLRQFEISNMYSEAGDNFSFQYVEAPDLPFNHSAPRPLLYTVMAVIFANLIAAGVIGAMMLWPQGSFSRAADRLVDGVFGLLHRLWPWGAPRGQTQR